LAHGLQPWVFVKIAIPVWDGRVSPVFDVATTVRVNDVDVESGECLGVANYPLDPARPASTLAGLGVDILICSAISSLVEATLWIAGIEVVSDICGAPDEIVEAWASGDEELRRFSSPGSRRRSTRSKTRRKRCETAGNEGRG
jgi:predicted Fe-Mo cluster-binding NifX family protein